MTHIRTMLRLTAPGLLTLFSGTAIAQTAGAIADNTRSFPVTYFTDFAPTTARDMLGRIPGFQPQSGDNKRGLGQGGANVLINGQRLAGKTDDPFEQVSRIAAKNVERIDIVDGTSLNIPGLSGEVANIITKKSSGLTGTWEWRPEAREGLQTNWLPGFITVSGERGDMAYTVKLNNNAFRNGHGGPETRTDSTGTLFETRDESARYNGDNPGVSLGLVWTPDNERTGNFNIEYNQFNFNNYTVSDLTAFAPAGNDGQHIFSRAEDEWNAKVDGDYEFPVGPGRLKLIGYYRVEDSVFASRFDNYSPTAHLNSTRYFQDADEGEAIVRTEYSLSPKAGQDWQLGIEGAFNFLDIEAQFFDRLNPANSGAKETSRVEEKRGEITLTHSRPLNAKWDLQASLGAEYSQLSQAALERNFFRPKGFVSATYKPSDNFSIRTKVEREVGQLNFFDFISSVSLDDNLNTTGNPDLVPSQSWNADIEFDKKFPAGHSFKARVYGRKISDLVDRIPIGTTGDAVGNIDSAEQYGVDFDATIKTEPFGLKGGELNLELDLRDSSVDDPVEGFSRRLNNDKKTYWSISFRHDIPETDWAWGFFSDQRRQADTYRLSTINRETFEGPWGHVFVEHKDIFGMKANVSLRNIFDASDDFRRVIYTGRRDTGTVDIIEERTRPFGYFLRLNLSGTF